MERRETLFIGIKVGNGGTFYDGHGQGVDGYRQVNSHSGKRSFQYPGLR